MTVFLLGCTVYEGGPTLNMTLEPSLFHLPVPFSSSSAISLLPLAVNYSRLSLPPTSTPLLRLVVRFRPYLHLSIRLLHERDGSRRAAEDYQ